MGDAERAGEQPAQTGHRLICGDVLDVLPTLPRAKCLISDPPDNIGLGYDEYSDSMSDDSYRVQLEQWLGWFAHKADISWISFNAKWLFTVGHIVEDWRRRGLYDYVEPRIFIQPFTFGQNRTTDAGNGYRPILRLKAKDAQLYPDQIRVSSWRQQNGDKRACPRGRVPLDVWDFPRVTGNSKQRRRWHPTQLHEGLVERMILFSTQPGDTIIDCFSGTGTVLRAVRNFERIPGLPVPRNLVTSIELDPNYCERIAAEHGIPWNLGQSKRWRTWAA